MPAIDGFVKIADQLMEEAACGGLITEERAHIITYRAGKYGGGRGV